MLIFILWVESQSPETQHGAILALGYMVGRNLSRKKAIASCELTENKVEEMSITYQDDDKLVSMATKTIGMNFFYINPFCADFIDL